MFAALLSIRLRSTTSVPPVLATPPPLDALPPVTRTRSSVREPWLSTTPPAKKVGVFSSVARPSRSVTPLIATVLPVVTSTTRNASGLPRIAVVRAPAPAIVTSEFRSSWRCVSW